jgi:hypothetical protein
MLYDSLKIVHILAATLVVGCMVHSYFLWKTKNTALFKYIEIETWFLIVPLAAIQLLIGFTMLSLHHEELGQFWVRGSIVAFLIGIGSWIGFVCLLLLERSRRRLESSFLSLSAIAFLSMIFLMANKI